MKPIILTGYTEEIREIAEICLPSKQAWAERHGCELIVLRDEHFPKTQGHPSFQKLRWIYDTLACRNVPVIWLDADSLITNLEVTPTNLLPFGHLSMAASRDYDAAGRPPHKAWSAGNTAWLPTRAVLDWLSAAQQDQVSRWGGLWDQDALQKTQPADVGVLLFRAYVMNAVLPEVGGHEAGWRPGDFLIHFTGLPQDQRPARARAFVAGLS